MNTASPGLSVIGLHKAFGPTRAVQGVSFDVQPGEILALLGPSGCGKSTTLALIAGLETPDAGRILWDGADLSGQPPDQRGFGLMFQDFALFPHLNVFDNLAFGLRMAGTSEAGVRQRVDELLALTRLAGLETRPVDALSGGERQRVALARSLAPRPRLLMLDEPLGDLDRGLKEQLMLELPEMLKGLGQTAVYVTHDQEEAFAVADRVAVMQAGYIEQIGSPETIYLHPASAFVARFVGLDNLLPAVVTHPAGGTMAHTQQGDFPVPAGADGPATLLIRPDAAGLTAGDGGVALDGRLVERSFRGSQQRVVIDAGGARLTFVFSLWEPLPQPGQPVRVYLDPGRAFQVLP